MEMFFKQMKFLIVFTLGFIAVSLTAQDIKHSLYNSWLNKDLKNPESQYYEQELFKSASVQNLRNGKSEYSKRRYKSAIKHFKLFLKEDTPLNDYALYYLGRCHFELKKYQSAADYFRKLQRSYPHSRFHEDSIENLAESYLKLGHWSKLIHQFETEMIMEEDEALLSLYYYYVGKTYFSLKKNKKAIRYLLKTAKYQDTWSLKAIDEILDYSKKNEVDFNINQFVLFAEVLYDDEQYDKALELLSKVKKVSDHNSQFLHSYISGLCHLDKGNLDSAGIYLKNAKSQAKQSADKTKASIALIQTYENTDAKKAISDYEKLLLFSDSKERLPALKKVLSYHYEKGNWRQFSQYLKNLAQMNQSKVIWNYLFDALNKNNLNEIVRYFPESVELLENEKMKSKFYYWVGVAALKSNQNRKAENFLKYSYLAYKYNYYSYKSLLYIQNYNLKKKFHISFGDLRKIDKLKMNGFLNSFEYKSKLRESNYPIFGKKIHPSLKRAFFCYKADYKAYGNKELNHLLSSEDNPEKYYRGLAYYFKNIKEYQLSIRYAFKLVDYFNGPDGHNYIPEDLVSYCYPKRFEHIVRSASKEHGVNPFLVYAVIREESRFNPKARSWAGARGLMQIMPRTGKYLAKKTNMKKINLYDVETNINLGAYYLSYLIKKFDSYSYALASYNGGPGRMNSRLKDALEEGDHILTGEHLIELISNNETRNYVKKVLKSYYCYLDIYNQID